MITAGSPGTATGAKIGNTLTGFNLYNGANAQVIAYTPGQHCSAPQINNLGQVAWRNSSSPVYNLYLWNGTNTKITNLDATNYDG